MKRTYILLLFMMLLIGTAAMIILDSEEEDTSLDTTQEYEEVSSKVASNVLVDLMNREGRVVATASMYETGDGVKIAIKGENLPPGKHGFHIHEHGICDPPDFESAGGHFNPTNSKHGFDHQEGPHAGDLKNIYVSKNGKLNTEVLADMVTLEKGKPNSLIREGGTALVIHAKADDYITQPAGDAGERIACGVIE